MNSDIRERVVSRVKVNLRGVVNEDGTVKAIEELRERCDEKERCRWEQGRNEREK